MKRHIATSYYSVISEGHPFLRELRVSWQPLTKDAEQETFVAYNRDTQVLLSVSLVLFNKDMYYLYLVQYFALVRSFDFLGKKVMPQSFVYQGARYSSCIHTSKNERSSIKGTIMETFLGNGVRWRVSRPGAKRQELGPVLPSGVDSCYQQYLAAVFDEMDCTLALSWAKMRKCALERLLSGVELTPFERLLLDLS